MTTESPRWFKSSYSSNGGDCIEIATNFTATRGVVPVRDSKNPHGPRLSVQISAWSSFVHAVRSGDLPA